MRLTRSTNAAGLPETLSVRRTSGGGEDDLVTAADYNARGQLLRLAFANEVTTEREYDSALERLTRLFTQHDDGSTVTHLQDLEYTYDPVGNPVEITDNLSTSAYKANQIIPNTRGFYYDARYRLTRATGKKHATVTDKSTKVTVSSPDPNDYDPYDVTYSYDAAGNLTRNDEYKSSGTTSLAYKTTRIDLFNGDSTEATNSDPTLGNFTYDANGNTLHTPRITELGYSPDNQVSYVDLSGGGEIRYFRHGDQRVVRMVKKTGVWGMSVYLGPFEYHYRDGGMSGTTYTKLVLHAELHGRQAQIERVLTGTDPDSLDTFYVHGDHLGSGHVLTNEDGTLLNQEEYFPYGRASDRRDARNRYRYIGVERDEDTGLCVTGPRTYDPVSGRFLQGDPLAEGAASWTPMHYAKANPIRNLDDNGYVETDEVPKQAPRATSEPPKPLNEFLVGSFGAAFDSYTGKLLVDHYLYGHGEPMHMAGQAGLDLNPNVDVTWRQDSNKPSRMMRHAETLLALGGGTVNLTDFEQQTFGGTNGGLGHATARYNGTLTVDHVGSWTFEGTVQFSDTYDFDLPTLKDWWDGNSHRTWQSELKVLVGAVLLHGGTPFQITTDAYRFQQSGTLGEDFATTPILTDFPDYEQEYIGDVFSRNEGPETNGINGDR